MRAATRNTRLDRAKRRFHYPRNFLIRQPLHIAQDQRQPLLGRQRQQRRLDLRDGFSAQSHALRVPGGVYHRLREMGITGALAVAVGIKGSIQRDGGATRLRAEMVNAAIVDDAIEPGAEGRAAKRAYRTIGGEERLLDRKSVV